MMDKQKQKAVRKAVGQESAFVDLLNQEMKELQDGLKQKQIEEMSKVLDNASCQGYECEKCFFDNIVVAKPSCVCVKALYEAGYRKIPEGAVVLTREEYEKLKNGEVTYNQMVRIVAEKFAERVKMAFYYEFDELIPSIMADKIDEICKDISEGKV